MCPANRSNMFYLIGLGLGDAKDVTVNGLEIIKQANKVYLEAYTSILTVGKEQLEMLYGRDIVLADREMVEQGSDKILTDASTENIAFLVVGDPVGATTHTDLMLRAREKGIECRIIHNASIMTAVGCCGLQLYNFGETVSIVFWTETWKPDSFFDKIIANRKRGLHTLCLLDIKMKEQTIENLMRGRKIYEPPRFMTVSQAAQQLIEIIENHIAADDTGDVALSTDTVCVGLARVGADDQIVASGTLKEFLSMDLGGPLHSLIIPGKMHPLEKDMLMALSKRYCRHQQNHPAQKGDSGEKKTGFYLIGLGLGNAKDITLKGLEIVQRAKRVFLEAYTSTLTTGKEALEELYGRDIILADREMVEQNSDELLADADSAEIAFLVVGDPVGATTHTDLMLRSLEKGVEGRVIHNASIMHAVGCCGLQLYNFGETVSIVFWTDSWRPDSFYDKLIANRKQGLHTLCLLDIKMKEQTIENMMRSSSLYRVESGPLDRRGQYNTHDISFMAPHMDHVYEVIKSGGAGDAEGRKIYEPPRFMSVSQAAEQLLEIIQSRDSGVDSARVLTADTVCVGLARIGSENQRVITSTLQRLAFYDLGPPLHTLVIPGHCHPLEVDMLLRFAEDDFTREQLSKIK